MEPSHDPHTAIARAHRRLIAERLPLFTGGWLAATVFWVLATTGDSGATWSANALLAGVQGTLFGLAVLLARRVPRSRHLQTASVGICIATALAGVAFCVHLQASAAIIAMMLLAVGVTSSLLFAWRAPVALLMFAGTWGPWMLFARPWPALGLTPLQCVAGAVVGGAVVAIIAEAAFADLRATVRAEKRLRDSEARFRSAFGNASVGMLMLDLSGRPMQVNAALVAMLGYSEDELRRMAIVDLTHPEDRAATRAHVVALLDGAQETFDLEKRYLHKDGRVVWGHVNASLVRDEHGGPSYALELIQDVTAQHASTEALRASEQKLRRLAHAQAVVREEERKRLGFDLHDDVCQELVGIGILIESACCQLGADAPGSVALRRAVAYLGEVVEHLRQLARELRPLPLRDLGLEGALRALAEGVSSTTTRVEVDVPRPVPRLAEDTEVTFYRVAHEAITNAVRHAAARTVTVRLHTLGRRLRLDVRDDGRGFDPGVGSETSIGLAGMEERARARGGELRIRSEPGRGTRVTLVCTLSASELANAA